jgi:hypothetical protein
MSYRLTLAECEVYLRKCARATGLSWGIAEEAGKTSRWLAAYDLPGPQLVLAHLESLQITDYSDYFPDCSAEPWQAKGGILCPIITGAALADRSYLMLKGQTFVLGKVAYPALLLPTVGMAARYYQTVFTVRWGSVSVRCFEDSIRIDGDQNDLNLQEIDSVICESGLSALESNLEPKTISYSIPDEAWSAIDTLSFKTYAPATEASRAGAGAGLTDND